MATEPVANILVVDDSEAICRALRDLLTMSGYTVRTAPSGERALQILETASMDLVITDLKMSGISGIQLLKKIKEKTPALPVVILTGFGDMDSVVEAMRSGVADYLKKPFSVNEVIQVTERELKRSKQLQAAAAVPTTAWMTPATAAPKPTRIFIFSAREADGIDKVLSSLRAETMAESVLLIEDSGHVVSAKGISNERDMPSLAALVVASRTTNAQMASLLGEGESFSLNYLEGQRVSVYSAGISQRLLLVVVVPKLVKQGAVWMYTKKAAAEIEKTVASAIQQAPKEERPPEKQPQVSPVEERSSEKQPQVPPVEERPPEKPAERPELVNELESLFSAEALAAGEQLAQEVQTLTFEEAMARGLLGNMQM
jgi:DNA-binding response OmpR family regulator